MEKSRRRKGQRSAVKRQYCSFRERSREVGGLGLLEGIMEGQKKKEATKRIDIQRHSNS